PRGLLLSTGEDTPRGQSVRARVLVLAVSPGDLGPPPPQPNPALTARQRDAADGRYAASLAGFLRWLAPQFDAIRARLPAEVAALRDRAVADGQHARTPGIVADLACGFGLFLEFAQAVGAVTPDQHTELSRRAWDALTDAGAAQAEYVQAAEPCAHFLRLL